MKYDGKRLSIVLENDGVLVNIHKMKKFPLQSTSYNYFGAEWRVVWHLAPSSWCARSYYIKISSLNAPVTGRYGLRCHLFIDIDRSLLFQAQFNIALSLSGKIYPQNQKFCIFKKSLTSGIHRKTKEFRVFVKSSTTFQGLCCSYSNEYWSI